MRRLLTTIVALALLAALGLWILGTQIERLTNRVAGQPPAPVSGPALALHGASTVVDLHADPLLWGRDLLARAQVGHVDLPRLRDGGVALQVFGLVTAVPVLRSSERTDPRWPDAITLLALAHRWPLATLGSRTARARYQAERFARMAEASEGGLTVIRSRADLERFLVRHAADRNVVGGVLGIEGAHALDGDLANLGVLFDAGVRMVGLAHFFDNAFAGSAHGLAKGGLTDAGRRLVREAEARGMVIDLAHASPAAIDDVLAIVTRPPVVSHTGVRATCDNPRNLSDEQLRAIAAAGGVIGIGVWETAVCGTSPADVARAMRHVAELVGPEHVALGTDFDGAVTTGFDASGLPAITQALIDLGGGDAAIRDILGGNALRILRAALPES